MTLDALLLEHADTLRAMVREPDAEKRAELNDKLARIEAAVDAAIDDEADSER